MDDLKIILLFLIIFIVESESKREYIERSTVKTDEFLELVGKSAAIVDFHETLNATYKIDQLWIDWKNVKSVFSAVSINLNGMISKFMLQSYRYIARHYMRYCDLAIRLIDENNVSDGEVKKKININRYVRGEIKFPDDRVNCIFTAFHDTDNINVKLLFEVAHYFRTINVDLQYPLRDLKFILHQYRKRFEDLFKSSKELQLPPDTADPVDTNKALHEFKQKIIHFSSIFCSPWKPFISNCFLSKTVLDEVRNETHFVRNVFLNERCMISGDIIEKNMKQNWQADDSFFTWDWIYEWNCDSIMKPQENEKYDRSFKPKKNFIKKFVHKIDRLRSPREPPKPTPEPMQTLNKIPSKKFTLAELKKELIESTNYYLNVIKYYNIVSDVMLMALIREGRKMIRGIKLVVRWSCSERTKDNTVNTIRELPPMLSAFKSVFDEFVVLMQYEKRMDVMHNPQKAIFDKEVLWFVRLLSYDRVRVVSKQLFCDQILKTFEATNDDDDVYPAGNSKQIAKFRGYYFDGPIFHVKQLYRFNAYGGFKYDEMVIVPES